MNLEKIEILPADVVEFTLNWADYRLAGNLPGDIAYRVIVAAMEPSAVIKFDHPVTPEQAQAFRDRFTKNRRES